MLENNNINELRQQLFADQKKRDAKWFPKANKYPEDGDKNKSLEKEITEFYFGWEKASHYSSEEEIKELELHSERTIPTTLKDMWLTIPGKHPNAMASPRGFCGASAVSVELPSPAILIAKMTQKGAYGQLRGLGILNYLSWIWDNDHSYLNIDDNAKPDDKRVIADTALTCFGHIQDDHCESHLVLHYDKDGIFGATFWSQDEQYIPTEPTFTGFKSPEELILKCLAACDVIDNHPDQENPEQPYSSVELIVQWMKNGEVQL